MNELVGDQSSNFDFRNCDREWVVTTYIRTDFRIRFNRW
jgi:hypothetical protein